MSVNGRKRVVVTGMGTVNPLGTTLDEFYKNLLAGKSGIRTWTSLDAEQWWHANMIAVEALPAATMAEKTLVIAPRP